MAGAHYWVSLLLALLLHEAGVPHWQLVLLIPLVHFVLDHTCFYHPPETEASGYSFPRWFLWIFLDQWCLRYIHGVTPYDRMDTWQKVVLSLVTIVAMIFGLVAPFLLGKPWLIFYGLWGWLSWDVWWLPRFINERFFQKWFWSWNPHNIFDIYRWFKWKKPSWWPLAAWELLITGYPIVLVLMRLQ